MKSALSWRSDGGLRSGEELWMPVVTEVSMARFDLGERFCSNGERPKFKKQIDEMGAIFPVLKTLSLIFDPKIVFVKFFFD